MTPNQKLFSKLISAYKVEWILIRLNYKILNFIKIKIWKIFNELRFKFPSVTGIEKVSVSLFIQTFFL